MKRKGLRVNMKKTKILISGIYLDLLEKSGKFPCGVCLKGVIVNSILCSSCNLWIHKNCSEITGRITKNPLFVYSRFQGSARPIDGSSTTLLVDGVNLNVEPSFCYLGDMLSSGNGCNQAIPRGRGRQEKLGPSMSRMIYRHTI